ncbi:MAG: hypothetical protein ACRC0L_00405 [Angustibacter sp.]
MTPETKIFVQLAPDEKGLQELLRLQRILVGDASARLIKSSALHLTVIHIGKLHRVIDLVCPRAGVAGDEVLAHAETFAAEAEGILAARAQQGLSLSTRGTALFGRAALACVFLPTPELLELYERSLDLLHSFLRRCGVRNTEELMRADDNLRNALSIRPHVTLAKFPATEFPVFPEQSINFLAMPVVYRAAGGHE